MNVGQLIKILQALDPEDIVKFNLGETDGDRKEIQSKYVYEDFVVSRVRLDSIFGDIIHTISILPKPMADDRCVICEKWKKENQNSSRR